MKMPNGSHSSWGYFLLGQTLHPMSVRQIIVWLLRYSSSVMGLDRSAAKIYGAASLEEPRNQASFRT